ncbi:hypothetical protein TPHA_0A04040 [Tetrapisispora phaffii CBS 4417]|uniref:Uncharacterized protein n=1 Tax=Tetrapisispora phaffii (strain ATCC 24235 / CBS 4417 / NBRC 1672 / NRRL Y-8282 / UCD 70-5) TaxID=1071381 RepID=G8BNK2_TETPH|nr:hypothetical protein TPHA_0A04040 [Tetrapisispora phaffii CBS 4417]CCE61480.1 hypothetical protein TPHA_0A04040 [Tetrapisispora phaffii CBS 4417]
MNYSQLNYDQQSMENSFNNLSFQKHHKSYGDKEDMNVPIFNQDSYRTNVGSQKFNYYNGNKESFSNKNNQNFIWRDETNNQQRNDFSYDTKENIGDKMYHDDEKIGADENLELMLHIKDAQIESLDNEIRKIKNILNEEVNKEQLIPQSNTSEQSLEIPQSLLHIFKRLSTALQETEFELEETNKVLESLLTAIALEPSNTSTKFGRYDVESLAHKMIVRIETLTSENQEMTKMIAYGRSKEKQIELELLKSENRNLKEQLLQLQDRESKQPSQDYRNQVENQAKSIKLKRT